MTDLYATLAAPWLRAGNFAEDSIAAARRTFEVLPIELAPKRPEAAWVPHPLHLALVCAEAVAPPALRWCLRHWIAQHIWRTRDQTITAHGAARAVEAVLLGSTPKATAPRRTRAYDSPTTELARTWLATLGVLMVREHEGRWAFRPWNPGPRQHHGPMAAGLLLGDLVADGGLARVFHGGLRHARGSVTLVIGGPGTGKTSVAMSLALSAVLQGGSAVFFSLEERGATLEQKVRMAAPYAHPADIRELEESRGLVVVGLDGLRAAGDPLRAVSSEAQRLLKLRPTHRDGAAPATVAIEESGDENTPGPFCCVLDSVSAYSALRQMQTDAPEVPVPSNRLIFDVIDGWRAAGVHTVLVMAAHPSALAEQAEYAADTVVDLRVDHDARRLRVVKSRFQSSSPGVHLLHISEGDGVRVFPDEGAYSGSHRRGPPPASTQYVLPVTWLRETPEVLPAQPDLPYDRGTHANDPSAPLPERDGERSKSCLRLAACAPAVSHTTVLGPGSAGKSLFALRMLTSQRLLAPTKDQMVRTESDRFAGSASRYVTYARYPDEPRSPRLSNRHRLLVVSFYHEEAEYRRRLRLLWRTVRPTDAGGESVELAPQALTTLRVYPGAIEPSVLVDKIERALERGALDGHSYSGVLVDGIHNALLACPRIADSPTVWNAVIGLVSGVGLPLVTTYSSMALKPPLGRGEYQFGGETPNGRVVEETLLARSNTTVLFTERHGRVMIRVPDSTMLRQAHDVGFAWSDTGGDYRDEPHVFGSR